MSSLVLELQHEALNPATDLADLLRKALVVAKKLNINDFQTWAENELNGYQDKETLPDYRKLRGIPQCLNRFHGWLPIQFSDEESENYWSAFPFREPISQIVALVNLKSDSNFVQVPYSHEGSEALLKNIGASTQVRLAVGITSLVPLLDSVKTIILNWAMKLEQDNILGEGMTFTTHEKEIAQSSTYNINNFYGPVSSSQIQQQTSDSSQLLTTEKIDVEPILKFINEMKERLSELELTGDTKEELNAELNTVYAQANSPKPKPSILRESLSSIRRILEGAGGAIAAHLLISLGSISI